MEVRSDWKNIIEYFDFKNPLIIFAVFKRSASEIPDCGKYAQFAGIHIEMVDIQNLVAVEEYEKNL